MMKFFNEALEESQPREDYQEFIKLCIWVLQMLPKSPFEHPEHSIRHDR